MRQINRKLARLKLHENEALQSNPRFWELIESARTADKG
jgi:hypothetical protein